MFVQVNEKKYSVEFRHKILKMTTHCIIKDTGVDGKPQGDTIATGIAVCAPTDQYCKAVGRKIALTRALKILTTNINEPIFSTQKVVRKAIRKTFWEAYLNRGLRITPEIWKTKVQLKNGLRNLDIAARVVHMQHSDGEHMWSVKVGNRAFFVWPSEQSGRFIFQDERPGFIMSAPMRLDKICHALAIRGTV